MKKNILILICSLIISSCSLNNNNNIYSVWDPLEPINRSVFSFNMFVDTYTLDPISKAYNYVIPEPASKALENHFNWIKTPISAFNSSLQGKHYEAFNSVANFSLNLLTFGFYDLANDNQLNTNESFDQTLAIYNVSTGPYIVIPFLGPSTTRGLASTIIDGIMDPLNLLGTEKIVKLNSTEMPLKAINTRAKYIDQINDLKYNSLDAYSVFKSVYMQRLMSEINDTNIENDNITDVKNDALDAFFTQN